MLLRPFEDRDYPRLVELRNALFPEYRFSEAEWRHEDASWEHHRYFKQRLVAEDDSGRVLAMGEISHMPSQFHPDKYRLDVAVDPSHQRQGIGGAVYSRLIEDLQGRKALLVRSEAKESFPHSIAFLEHRGFHEVQRFWESRLDVTTFDPTPFAGAEAKAAAAGIEVTTLTEERERIGDAALRAAYELDRDIMHDVPMTDPATDTSYEHFLTGTLDSPGFLPDAWFFAKDGDRFAGLSNLWKSQELPGVLFQGLTGVRREYRRKGIAQALKLYGLRYAREHGYREIRTWNNTRNRPMLSINEAMGFVKQPVWIEFERTL
jgi:GNAT superfamily N-acetyltransferase